MIVVETRTVVYLAPPNKFAELADAVLRTDAEWHSSVPWRFDFRNAMAGYFRRGEAAVDDGWHTLSLAEAIVAPEHVPDAGRILALIQSSRCSAYDLEFVAVAQTLSARLFTNNKQILADFPSVAISPGAFAA